MKLWQKDCNLDKEIEKFTVGDDYILDKALIKYDVIGNIAHAKMLCRIGIISNSEFNKLKKALKEILELNKSSKFEIALEDEDVHTAVENFLTKKLGDLGKKIHTARSRNDQVLVDTRLYSKEKMLQIFDSLIELAKSMVELSKKNEKVPMPGYTHTQKAMPSSVGLLFGAYAESLLDDIMVLKSAYKLNDQCPLGSAAGYGVNLNIDRKYASDMLGFNKVQNNTLYVQNSRGKIESVILFGLSQIMSSLAKMSNDLILFSMPEFYFFSLPDQFCTGSSIMPQKKNPDVLELMRAKSAVVESYVYQMNSIREKLISGYNRDLQLTKKPLIEGFEITLSSINIMALIINNLKVHKENCAMSCTKELFAADKAYELVKKGMPFREAYKEIGGNLEKIEMSDPVKNIMSKKHLGAAGNLNLKESEIRIKLFEAGQKKEKIKLNNAIIKVLM